MTETDPDDNQPLVPGIDEHLRGIIAHNALLHPLVQRPADDVIDPLGRNQSADCARAWNPRQEHGRRRGGSVERIIETLEAPNGGRVVRELRKRQTAHGRLEEKLGDWISRSMNGCTRELKLRRGVRTSDRC